MQQPAEGIEPGHISSVMGIGFKLGERVVRPAKVGVVPQPDDSSGLDEEG
jgi:molecular chaperone GrpE